MIPVKYRSIKKRQKQPGEKQRNIRNMKQKTKDRNAGGYQAAMMQMMGIFAEFGEIRTGEPDSARAQQLVKKLQRCITDNYYTCSDKVLLNLAECMWKIKDLQKILIRQEAAEQQNLFIRP